MLISALFARKSPQHENFLQGLKHWEVPSAAEIANYLLTFGKRNSNDIPTTATKKRTNVDGDAENIQLKPEDGIRAEEAAEALVNRRGKIVQYSYWPVQTVPWDNMVLRDSVAALCVMAVHGLLAFVLVTLYEFVVTPRTVSPGFHLDTMLILSTGAILGGPVRLLIKQGIGAHKTAFSLVFGFICFLASVAILHNDTVSSTVFQARIKPTILSALSATSNTTNIDVLNSNSSKIQSPETKVVGYTAIISLIIGALCALLFLPAYQVSRTFFDTHLPTKSRLNIKNIGSYISFLAPAIGFLLLSPAAFGETLISSDLVNCGIGDVSTPRDCAYDSNGMPVAAQSMSLWSILSLGIIPSSGNARFTESQWLAVRLIIVGLLSVYQIFRIRKSIQVCLESGKEQQVNLLTDAVSNHATVNAIAANNVEPLKNLVTAMEFARLRVILSAAIYLMNFLVPPLTVFSLAILAYRRSSANLGAAATFDTVTSTIFGKSFPDMISGGVTTNTNNVSLQSAVEVIIGKDRTAFFSLLLSPVVLRQVTSYILTFVCLFLAIFQIIFLYFIDNVAPAFEGGIAKALSNLATATSPVEATNSNKNTPAAAVTNAAAALTKNTKKNK